MRRVTILTAAVVLSALAAAGPASATVDLTAVGTRIGDHPTFVRVVVDFTDGVINAPAVIASDPNPYPDGRVRIVVPGRNAQAQAPTVTHHRITARVLPGHNRVAVSVTTSARRLKYAGYTVLHDPERLVIDLYKSKPRAPGSSVPFGRPGCLTLSAITTRPGSVTVSGTENNVFEHSFGAYVRATRGLVLGRRTVTAADGRWQTRITYRVGHRQEGMVEAVELSAKDGSLSCLVQAPVTLQPVSA